MITPAQCRAARAWLNMTQEELAQLAGCATSVVVRFEREQVQTVRAIVESIQRALQERGVNFTQSLDGSIIGIEYSSTSNCA